MPGIKRKLPATREHPARRDVPMSEDNASDRRTSRSGRDTRSSRVNRNWNGELSSPAPAAAAAAEAPVRRSRIVTLSTRGARGRETRNSKGRVLDLSTRNRPTTLVSPQEPETPRPKRAKKDWPATETPRTTRQSARLRAHADPSSHEYGDLNGKAEEDELQVSPSITALFNNRAQNKYIQSFDGVNDPPDSADNKLTSTSPGQSGPSPAGKTQNASAASEPEEDASKDDVPGETNDMKREPYRTEGLFKVLGSSTRTEADDANDAVDKKHNVENEELDRSLEEQLQKGPAQESEELSASGTSADHNAQAGSHRETGQTAVSTPANDSETASAAPSQGGRGGRAAGTRGGRGGRSRGRGGRAARGRGARTRSSAKHQDENSSDFEVEIDRRSPPPTEITQKLRERQRELDRAFKRVALAQRLALSILAAQSHERLARDKHAHEKVPEWEAIQEALQERLEKQREIYRAHYRYRVEQENKLYAAAKEKVEQQFKASACHIKEEHLKASQGAYMAFVEGVRVAEDEEHTETDRSDNEFDSEPLFPGPREFIRGFNSSHVRDPQGAALYEHADTGWDDFVQRAKVGGEVKGISDSVPFAGLSAPELIAMLVAATGTVELGTNGENRPQQEQPRVDDAARPDALLALADAATVQPLPSENGMTAPPQPPTPYQAFYPKPQTTEPRPFPLLHPSSPQKQHPRRLLPAGRQQIPPINQQLSLPDPFESIGGRPHLPPPSGSNFHQPLLPGYFPTPNHPQQLYYPPQGPPAPPGAGPRHPY